MGGLCIPGGNGWISYVGLECCTEISVQVRTDVNTELAELNSLGFNHFPNRVVPLVHFLGDDCNFRGWRMLVKRA